MSNPSRQPAGVPSGGQFAPSAHDEPDFALMADEAWIRDAEFANAQIGPDNLGPDAPPIDWEQTDHGVPPAAGDRSPWGDIDNASERAPGITDVVTPSHGGTHLSAARNKQVHPAWRSESGWYEEDVEWVIPALTFPDDYTPRIVDTAERMAKDYRPHEYSEVFGVPVDLSESDKLRREAFAAAHANDFIATSASFTGPADDRMVLVHARIGGRDGTRDGEVEQFLVTEDDYQTRNQNPGGQFVIDLARHPRASVVRDRDLAPLKAEFDEALAALRDAGVEADADDPAAVRYRAASDAVNHAHRTRDFAIASGHATEVHPAP